LLFFFFCAFPLLATYEQFTFDVSSLNSFLSHYSFFFFFWLTSCVLFFFFFLFHPRHNYLPAYRRRIPRIDITRLLPLPYLSIPIIICLSLCPRMYIIFFSKTTGIRELTISKRREMYIRGWELRMGFTRLCSFKGHQKRLVNGILSWTEIIHLRFWREKQQR
jgi:hypothetical protein